jgi:hypothetical protein
LWWVHADTRARTSTPAEVDQDHAVQVEHDVLVTLADQMAQVLPQRDGLSAAMSPRTATMAWPSEVNRPGIPGGSDS